MFKSSFRKRYMLLLLCYFLHTVAVLQFIYFLFGFCAEKKNGNNLFDIIYIWRFPNATYKVFFSQILFIPFYSHYIIICAIVEDFNIIHSENENIYVRMSGIAAENCLGRGVSYLEFHCSAIWQKKTFPLYELCILNEDL